MAIDKERIGVGEAVVLAVVFVVAKVFLTFPASMVNLGLSSAWLVTLIAMVSSILAFIPIVLLMYRFPEKSIVEVGEYLVGPYANTAFFLGYLAFIVAVESMVLRQFAERAITVSNPELPISVAMVGMVLGAAVACYLGLESIARSARIAFIFVGGLFFLVVAATYPYWKVNNLFPYLGPGVLQIMSGGIARISIASEIFLLAIIYPSIKISRSFSIWRLSSTSLVISGIILVVTVFTYQLAFPVPVAQEIPLPTFEMARLISFGRFVQRLEPIFLPMWGLAALLKLTIGLYAMLALITSFLKLPYYRPFILPLAVITMSLAFIPPNVSTALMIDETVIRTWGWIPTFALPVILLAVATWRRKGLKPE